MATFTSKSWSASSFLRNKSRRLLLCCLAFIGLSAFHEATHFSEKDFHQAATSAAFEGCENNLLKNGNFQYNASNWQTTPTALQGVASSYTTDGNFHAWLLPLTGTAEFYQEIPTNSSIQEFSFLVNAGVDDPTGQHLVGLQFISESGTILGTESVEVNNDLTASGTLQAYTLSGIPPTGTATTKVFGSSDGGYLRMDNFCFTLIEDPFAAPANCSFNLGEDEEYCGESISLAGPDLVGCDNKNTTYLWTVDGKPLSTQQNIVADGIGTYCLTYTDCDGCSTTDCIDLTACFTGSPAANTTFDLSSLGLQTFFDCGDNRIIEPVAYGYLENPRPMTIPNQGNVLGVMVEVWMENLNCSNRQVTNTTTITADGQSKPGAISSISDKEKIFRAYFDGSISTVSLSNTNGCTASDVIIYVVREEPNSSASIKVFDIESVSYTHLTLPTKRIV